ncbi:MAG: ABC transporter permease [Candidatus Tectomicrobia bacterium]|uniref:ABC transporter permease n=1 Tax=Tectimicrobiota bacterium TaxID=2528274 RepID=A0A938B448_UNCTE|nr:ABC transporter permease [Candidatus Tectomicrobia bacterium]
MSSAPAAPQRQRWRKFLRHPLGVIGSLIVLAVCGSALCADWLAPHEPNKQRLIARFKPPVWASGGSTTYLLGTDNVGRDIFSRILHGSRISLLVGIAAVGVSLGIGVTLGLLSGFLGGRVDTTIMAGVDIMLAFPQLILAFAMVAVLGPGLGNIILVLGLTGWERYARVVRAEVLALREREFVQASRALGVPTARIILRHIMPNTFSSVIVMATLQTAQAILAEASLSFLGLGTGLSYPSWGQMIALGRDYVNVAWWLSTFPGLAILLTVLAINLLGDRARDLFDPRMT